MSNFPTKTVYIEEFSEQKLKNCIMYTFRFSIDKYTKNYNIPEQKLDMFILIEYSDKNKKLVYEAGFAHITKSNLLTKLGINHSKLHGVHILGTINVISDQEYNFDVGIAIYERHGSNFRREVTFNDLTPEMKTQISEIENKLVRGNYMFKELTPRRFSFEGEKIYVSMVNFLVKI